MASGRVPKMSRTGFGAETESEGLLVTVSDASLREVIRRHLEGDAIAGQNADAIAPQFAGQVSENGAVLIELNAEESAGEFFDYGTSNFYAVFFTHSPLTKWDAGGAEKATCYGLSIAQIQGFSRSRSSTAARAEQWFTLESGLVAVTKAIGEFKDKNFLVTGAGRGIGKRLALGFARLGGRIALVGRSKAELDMAHIEIEQAGGNALRIRADVTDPEQLALAVDRSRVVFGGAVDVMICAAGTLGPIHDFMEHSLKAWKETLAINLFGVVHSFRAVLPSMTERRAGKIIVIACESDALPKTGLSAYSTSKSAVVRFVETVAAEVVEDNVQINCFDPGPAYTNMTDELIRAENRLEARVVSEAKETRRTGGTSPDLQMKVAAFLASEQSNHITGKLIHVTDDTNKLRNETLRPDAYTLRRMHK